MKKRIVALLLAVLLVLSCAPMGMAYTTEAYQAATHLNQLGLFAGSGTNPDGTPNYDLDAQPTRAQGIVMLLALLGERANANSSYTSSFTDLPSWAKNYVNYAYTKGYTGGVSKTKFGTNNPITSNQYLTFVLVAMGYSSASDFNWKDPYTLSDSLGITNGQYYLNCKFTRGDMCIISDNALNAKIKGADKTLMDKLIEQGVLKPEAKPETVSQQVIYDKDGYKVTVTGMEKDSYSTSLKMILENNTDQDIIFQIRDSSVNGYMIYGLFSCSVSAGKKSTDEFVFLNKDLERCGISRIADFEFAFKMVNPDFSTKFSTDLIKIKTSAADTFQYEFDDTGKQLYNSDGIKIVYKKVEATETYETSIVLYIENATEKAKIVQLDNVSINGYMIQPLFSCTLTPGKHAIDDIAFLNETLEENNISEISEVQLQFVIFNDDDDYTERIVTEYIKFNTK